MADETQKDEKTEDATHRRRQETREKGQVPYSTELMAATMLMAAIGAGYLAGGELVEKVAGLFSPTFEMMAAIGAEELVVADSAGWIRDCGKRVIPALVMFIVPMILVGLVVGYGHVGFQITPQAIAGDLSKLNPVKGLQRLFSMRSAVRTLLSASKILVIVTVVGTVAAFEVPHLAALTGLGLGPVLGGVGYVLMRCVFAGVLSLAAIALLDVLFQRRQHENDMRMSRKEVKEELKNTDGDPHVRARIRQVQREMASRRMMAEVPKATVVVTNPTHYAIALFYDRSAGDLAAPPRIVAKGVDRVAEKIKEVAREANVPLYEDRALARLLYAQVEIGEAIPGDLFQAVASVLAYVYRLQGEPAPA